MKRISTMFIFLLSIFLVFCSPVSEPKEIDLDKIQVKKELNPCDELIQKIPEKSYSISLNLQERMNLIYSAKSQPVFFVRTPQENVYTAKTQPYADAWKSNPWSFVIQSKEYLKHKPQIGYEIFLKEQYLYADKPYQAEVLSQSISLDMMFKAKELWIQRGSLTMHVEKIKSKYYFTSGPFINREATVMLFDRISETEIDESKSLHIDFVPIQHQLNSKTITPFFISDQHVVADVLYYDGNESKILLNRVGAKLSLQCENRDIKHEYNTGLRNFQSSILAQVSEQIPFDEPKFEFGQEDGKLRDTWMFAFHRRRTKYVYNHDFYYVYDHLGRPIPPQVCIDFIVDAFDRAAGSWYTDLNNRKQPGKTPGLFDSSKFMYTNEEGEFKKYAMRNIDGFLQFVKDNPGWFELKEINTKIRMGSNQFWSELSNLELKTGDAVFIKGSVPWDKEKSHSHSFIIFETDPITGLPSSIAGNANSAALRAIKMETVRTPDRYVFMVIRPKQELLNLFTTAEIKDIIPK